LDLLDSFGGRLRELSLENVSFGGNRRDDGKGRCLPGLESVCLGYEGVVRPKGSAFDQTHDMCEILENIAPNVNELQLFKDDVGGVCMGPVLPEVMMLRLPKFRGLKSVTVRVPGPHWADLIYEIAAWFARDEKFVREIADPACQDGRASALNDGPSLPSRSSATRAEWQKRKRLRIRFAYPLGEDDIDWERLERAVLGGSVEGLDEGGDCTGYGNYGGGAGDDDGQTLMRISRVENRWAGGSRSGRSTVGSLRVEGLSGSVGVEEVREKLGRLDRLGLLQVSCR